MDLERLQGDLRRLTEIVGGWDASKEIDALERDLVLEKLRGLYEAVRFGMPVAAPAEPAVGEASAPIDLGEVLSLDPLSDLPAPDADALPEVQPPFVEVLSTVSEPEMVSVLEAAAEQTAVGRCRFMRRFGHRSADKGLHGRRFGVLGCRLRSGSRRNGLRRGSPRPGKPLRPNP